jgi:D-serine deaminase-like pyridoxal phosphate-dependent protein
MPPMLASDVDTPSVIVDLARVERNIARLAEIAQKAGVRLRPHAKTHKCPDIARLQIAAGAPGVTLAKIGEAEAFADAGLDDFFLAYPIVGDLKARRLRALAERARVIVGVDSEDGAASLASAFADAPRPLEVRLEIDTGLGRTGVLPEHAHALARAVSRLPGLRLQGLFTHAGHAYAAGSPEAIAAIGRGEGDALVRCAEALRAEGFAIEDVSVGSTPTAIDALRVRGVTECRPGTYVFNDATQVALGVCRAEDCALTVLATVVSVPAADRVVIDAGSKTLASELIRPKNEAFAVLDDGRGRVIRVTEEHGIVEPAPGAAFRVGDRVSVVPSHVCPVVNLHDRLLGFREGRLERELLVAARGRVR